MKFNEIIRAAMKDAGVTQTQLGEMLGVRQGAVGNVLRREEIMLGTFVEYLNVMGYDIIVRPRDGGKEMTLTDE